jgi:uncharacterized protein YndB with AHSA1/START domain
MSFMTLFGAEQRRVELVDHLGKPAIVAVAVKTYDTAVDDLWNAVTTASRIARWLGPISGELELAGRFQIKGNASGSITRCDAPKALDVTWEIAGGTSWVQVRLEPVGARARLTLEHIAHRDGIGKEHLDKFGPGAVGVGWELGLAALARHLSGTDIKPDPAWFGTPEAKAFVRSAGEAWGEAHAASGEDAAEARAKAERTIAAFGG